MVVRRRGGGRYGLCRASQAVVVSLSYPPAEMQHLVGIIKYFGVLYISIEVVIPLNCSSFLGETSRRTRLMVTKPTDY